MELIKQLKAGTSPLDIIHGEMKVRMLEIEERLELANGADSLYPYLEGVLDAYSEVYKLTYDLSFAQIDINNNV